MRTPTSEHDWPQPSRWGGSVTPKPTSVRWWRSSSATARATSPARRSSSTAAATLAFDDSEPSRGGLANPVTPTEPFGSGSISLRLYPHDDLDAPALIDEMRAQAVLAIEHGVHGVMTSEHHGGFGGFIPHPPPAGGAQAQAEPDRRGAPL